MTGDLQIANRVSQLESRQLDRELDEMVDDVVEQLEISSYSEELKTVLKLYLLVNNVSTATTPGMRVYNLAFCDLTNHEHIETLTAPSKHRLALFAAINLVGAYFNRRADLFEKLLKGSKLAKMNLSWLSVDNAILLAKSLKIMNFIAFLRGGAYLSLSERIFGLAPSLTSEGYHSNMLLNRVQMDFMYREMIWRALAEFLTTMIPLVNVEHIKNSLARFTGLMPKLQSEMSISEKMAIESDSKKCVICMKQPFNPYIIGCRHVFCHYCLQSKYISDPSNGYVCQACEYKTHNPDNIQRYKLLGHLQ